MQSSSGFLVPQFLTASIFISLPIQFYSISFINFYLRVLINASSSLSPQWIPSWWAYISWGRIVLDKNSICLLYLLIVGCEVSNEQIPSSFRRSTWSATSLRVGYPRPLTSQYWIQVWQMIVKFDNYGQYFQAERDPQNPSQKNQPVPTLQYKRKWMSMITWVYSNASLIITETYTRVYGYMFELGSTSPTPTAAT